MLSIIKRMTEEHVRELIPMGLEKGIKGALECHACLVIQEVLQICSLIGAMSSDLHEEIANWTSSRVISLLMHDYPGVPPNFIYALASFVQELCHRKPMSELVVSYTATCARSLVQNKVSLLLFCEDENCREAGLNIILEIARNEGYIMIFQHSFLKKIVELFESAVENEAKLAFLIVGSFVKQHNDNTNGNPTYKYELCVALHSLNVVWKREDAVKAAGVQYIEIMCNILKNNNSDHVACCVSVMHSILEACLTLKANFELQQAKDIIKALKADKYLAEFVDHTQEDSSIHNLADDLYNLCLGNIKVDSDEEEDHAETEDASRA
uniref:Fanconi anemia group I protein n=1 Tax=Elaeophora elaphi TaxID=1147741 RepID=A0A0R3RKP6_9BILA